MTKKQKKILEEAINFIADMFEIGEQDKAFQAADKFCKAVPSLAVMMNEYVAELKSVCKEQANRQKKKRKTGRVAKTPAEFFAD